MRIAATYENGMVGQHFGRTEQFKIYDVSDNKIQSARIIDTNGTGHGALAGFLYEAGVEILICGGIGMGARAALQNAGIEVLPGVSGNADTAVTDYLNGNLAYDPETECDHHDHQHGEDHECGNHEHGCGGHECH